MIAWTDVGGVLLNEALEYAGRSAPRRWASVQPISFAAMPGFAVTDLRGGIA